jgi:hypothetical protein
MSGSGLLGALSLAALLLLACGGRAAGDSAAEAAGSGGVANANNQECLGGESQDFACAGAAGERSLEAYARLHAACRLDVTVNRRGAPVTIDCRIH